jgi:hypothetical protein
MEKKRNFQNEQDKKEYERLKTAMHSGLIYAEGGYVATGVRNAVMHITSLLLVQGIAPKFSSGGDVWKSATEDFLETDKKRIEALIKMVKKKKIQ